MQFYIKISEFVFARMQNLCTRSDAKAEELFGAVEGLQKQLKELN
jgi:hypothetical protein